MLCLMFVCLIAQQAYVHFLAGMYSKYNQHSAIWYRLASSAVVDGRPPSVILRLIISVQVPKQASPN